MVFPRTTEEVAAIVKIAAEHGIPIVGRGAGTGLSGGAIPRAGGVMIGFSRMNRILEIDLENERAVLQPGVVNLDITLAVQAIGYFYAPDPSSQRACTIGGNVAENSGGPHTLAYGVTTNHVLGLEFVLPDGTVHTTGGKELDLPGYDLTGLLTGSEGTMALVTKIIVRLMRQPEKVKTILAIYNSASDCGGYGGRDHGLRHHAGCGGDAGWRDAAHGGRGDARRVSDGCGGGAADRTGRADGSGGRADRADPRGLRALRRARVPGGADGRRARPAVEGPQECVRRGGPREPVVLRAGRRGAAHADRAHAALHRRGRRRSTI